MKTMIRERNVIFLAVTVLKYPLVFYLLPKLNGGSLAVIFLFGFFEFTNFALASASLSYTYCTQSKRKQLLQNGGEIKS
jgi:hypothetical protein